MHEHGLGWHPLTHLSHLSGEGCRLSGKVSVFAFVCVFVCCMYVAWVNPVSYLLCVCVSVCFVCCICVT